MSSTWRIGTLTWPAPSVPAPFIWYDAQDIAGVADGAALATWHDLASGFDLSQSSPTNRPTFYSSTAAFLINGHPAVWVAGVSGATSYYMNTVSVSQAGPLTLMAVVTTDQPAAGITQNIMTDNNTPATSLVMADSVTPVYTIQGGGSSSSLSGGTVDMHAHLVVAVLNGASSALDVDGVQVASGTLGTAGITNGLRFGNVSPANGDVGLGEFRVYTLALTSQQRNFLHLEAQNKWGTP